MSRWIEEFENHPFQDTWTELKKQLKDCTIDDETQITSVKELARLNKAISYLNKMMGMLDLELVPLKTWTNFQNQLNPCLQQITNYNSNRNIAHLQNANTHVDNLLSYIRPYMIWDHDGEFSHVVQNSLIAYSKSIDKTIKIFQQNSLKLANAIQENKTKSDELLSNTESSKEAINSFENEIFGQGDEPGKKNELETLYQDILEKQNKIQNLYKETLIGDENQVSIKKEVLGAKDEILSTKSTMDELLKEVRNKTNALDEYHDEIFGNINSDDEDFKGRKQDFENLMEDLSEFQTTQKTKYQAIIDQIQSLLPSATNAGLASAYKTMKDSFDKPISNSSKLFYFSITLLILASIYSSISGIGKWYINFVDFSDWSVVLKSLLYKTPLYGPIVWLAFYASKRRSEYQRLQQEYSHKKTLAQSYDSFKKQLEELEAADDLMKLNFIKQVTDAIAFNASTTLDKKHGDNMPTQDIVEKAFETWNKQHKK